MARGANPFLKDNEDDYPLHWAAMKGHADCVDTILENGVPSTISQLYDKDITGETPLGLAKNALKKKTSIVDKKKWGSAVKTVEKWMTEHERSKKCFGLTGKIYDASSTVSY